MTAPITMATEPCNERDAIRAVLQLLLPGLDLLGLVHPVLEHNPLKLFRLPMLLLTNPLRPNKQLVQS